MIELLVVISIIGALVGLILPALGRARGESKRTACASTLRQAGVAMRSYLDSAGDVFPFASLLPSESHLPLDDPPAIYIADVLLPHAQGASDVFRCPADAGDVERPSPNEGKSYFETERSSYEYRTRLRGRTMAEYIRRQYDQIGVTFPENSIWVMRDYNNFHGTAGENGSRRYLYQDGHVTDFELN